MAFRNPLYLDIPLLNNVADHYGVEVPTPGEVTRRTVEEKSGTAGVDKIVKAGRESGRTEEVIERFSTTARPVRLMNDTIDQLLHHGEVIDRVSDDSHPLVHRSLIQVEGDLIPSPATEIGSLMGRFMPLLMAQAGQGRTDFQPTDAEIAQLFLNPAPEEHPHVYDLKEAVGRDRLVVIMAPEHVYGGVSLDDVEGEMTVFGLVDRVLAAGSSMSLERYLLPGMSRTMRRAMGQTSMEELVESFAEMPGQDIDSADLEIHGPAAVIKPAAVY